MWISWLFQPTQQNKIEINVGHRERKMGLIKIFSLGLNKTKVYVPWKHMLVSFYPKTILFELSKYCQNKKCQSIPTLSKHFTSNVNWREDVAILFLTPIFRSFRRQKKLRIPLKTILWCSRRLIKQSSTCVRVLLQNQMICMGNIQMISGYKSSSDWSTLWDVVYWDTAWIFR
jgi:hypothetical protein